MFEYTRDDAGKLVGTGETLALAVDQVLVAIGQGLDAKPAGLDLEGSAFARSEGNKATRANVWVGGDCASGGDDLTVSAVEDGKIAAMSIHKSLMG